MFRARKRLFSGLAVGIVMWFALPLLLDGRQVLPVTRAIMAWDAGVLVFLLGIAVMVAGADPKRMAANAEAQQDGQNTIFALTLGAVVFSFAALMFDFTVTGPASPLRKDLHVALSVGTLFLSWLMCQVTFALRYAHEYYWRADGAADFARGLEFPSEPAPDYLDFLYFSIVVGMTFQVSDVQITGRKLRRLALLHGMLGFFFNTIIIALTVNLAAGLFTPAS
jgi:uncharacterized membrane protein